MDVRPLLSSPIGKKKEKISEKIKRVLETHGFKLLWL